MAKSRKNKHAPPEEKQPTPQEADVARRLRSCGELLDLMALGAPTFGMVVKIEDHILARRTAGGVTFTTVVRVGDSVAVFAETRTDIEAMRADLEDQLLRLRSQLGQIWQSSEVGSGARKRDD